MPHDNIWEEHGVLAAQPTLAGAPRLPGRGRSAA